MDALEFTKGHGTGNDFVIIADPEAQLVLTPKLVAGLCDRRFGIGADGVLRVVRTAAAVRAAESGVDPRLRGAAEWFMDYRNGDGSIAEMCGNGARVFARYLVESGLVATAEVTIGTRAGAVAAVVGGGEDGAVSVTMNRPRPYGESTARLGGVELAGVAVDTGNPHLVCQLPAGLDLAALDLTAPPAVDPGFFPDGVNVELVAPPPGEPTVTAAAPDPHLAARMRVYERGSGETSSCGSGACAVAAVVLRDAGMSSGVVAVDVPGGRLRISITEQDCALTGPTALVANGTVDLSALP